MMPDKDYQSKRDELVAHALLTVVGSVFADEFRDRFDDGINKLGAAIDQLVSEEPQKAADERESKLLDELEDLGRNEYELRDWIASKRQQPNEKEEK